MIAKKPYVYIASPYTKGDPAINTHFQCAMFEKMLNDGIVWPIAPLMSHFQHLIFPRPYKDWIDYDLAMLPLYDACIRLDATCERIGYSESKSSGADGEVAFFKSVGKPVFYKFCDLYNWVREGCGK